MKKSIRPCTATLLSLFCLCAAAQTVTPLKGQSPQTTQQDISACQALAGSGASASTNDPKSGGRVRGAAAGAAAGAAVAGARGNRNWGRDWNRGWRGDRRYDWQRYRVGNRHVFHLSPYYAPYRNWNYRRFSIGLFLDPLFYGQNYWIGDPYYYRLPPAPPGTEWVRYYNDVLLVDVYSGEVVDAIYDFFW